MKDTLVIIGNGFDIWQGLNSGYSEFKKYYYEHIDEILKKLHIKKHIILDSNGHEKCLTDVDIIYGNPFSSKDLGDNFWGTFENSLSVIDAETINLYFGKSRNELKALRKSTQKAKKILSKAFTDWVATLNVSEKATSFSFGENCIFINFNYTNTLSKRFKIKESDIFHIHGDATDKESIVFGHSSHPQLPDPSLYEIGGRFRGLFFIEEILYETDKHIQDNIQLLIAFLALHNIKPDDIKKIYVLGHSMSLPDIEYFSFLLDATKIAVQENRSDCTKDNAFDNLDEMHNRINYSINRYGYRNHDVSDEQRNAVQRQLNLEQESRNNYFEQQFKKMFHLKNTQKANHISQKSTRKTDAEWHISYYNDRDRIWIEKAMEELGSTNYKLYNSIEKCLENMQH